MNKSMNIGTKEKINNKKKYRIKYRNAYLIIALFICVIMVNLITSKEKRSLAAGVDDICNEIDSDIYEMSKASPELAKSSNPYDYIDKSEGYNKLIDLGEGAIPFILDRIENSDEGLASYMLAVAIEDISGRDIEKETGIEWSTSEEFLKAWSKVDLDEQAKVSRDISSFLHIGSKINYKKYYKFVECNDCETRYDENYKDSYGNLRQFGVKMCDKHQNNISSEASFYDYGYTDYNCLAYALGETEPCSWRWPSSWGSHPGKKQVERYFKIKSYTVEDFDKDRIDFYKDKRAIYVYGYNSSIVNSYIITHFGRTDELNGNLIEGVDTISKWGVGAIYTTKTTNPYDGINGYGECIMVCYK